MIDYLIITLIGAGLGSFISMLSYRLPNHLESDTTQLVKGLCGRSQCPHCHSNITWPMLIPLLSWLSNKGRSSCCQTQISWRYPLIELISSLLSIATFYLYNHHIDLVTPWYQSLEFWSLLTFSYLTLTIAIIDFEHYLIPDRLSIPLLWLGLLAASLGLPHWQVSLEHALYGAVFGYTTLWLIFQLHRAITGREGMGYGDFKLLAALGAWVGLHQVSLIFGISGALFILVALIQQKLKPDHVMPFGPFLVAAAWILMVASMLDYRFF